jgi:tetratricopeptide (TPR) repeat protein
MTLNNRGTVLSDLGRRDEALAAYDEALGLITPFSEADPQAFGDRFLTVLRNRIRLEGGDEAWEAFLKQMTEGEATAEGPDDGPGP